LDLTEEDEIQVRFDGKVHVNAFLVQSEEVDRVKVHLAWHGTIELTVADMPTLTFELKNAQLMADAYLPAGNFEALDLKVNFHINGEMAGYGVDEIDLDTHILLDIQDGQLTKLKICLPELADMVLAE
jgi:hypothetical protein